MGPRSGAGPGRERLLRFTRAERALHWATATLLLVCAVTGLILYVGSLSAYVGQRDVLKNVHVYTGLALPVPLVLAYAGRWRGAVRRDVRRLARWTPADSRWLRSLGRRAGDQVGKFNAGQKANAAFVAGLIPVMLVTGSIMRWFEPFPLTWRTGATFVHDWVAVVTWIVVTGHILVALTTPSSLRAMVVGWVPARWARSHHPAWANEESRPQADTTNPPSAGW